MEIWLIITAVVFTAFGYYWGMTNRLKYATEAVINSLIEQGYLRTRGTGKNMEMLKWRE